jgi:hypothetical protein
MSYLEPWTHKVYNLKGLDYTPTTAIYPVSSTAPSTPIPTAPLPLNYTAPPTFTQNGSEFKQVYSGHCYQTQFTKSILGYELPDSFPKDPIPQCAQVCIGKI